MDFCSENKLGLPLSFFFAINTLKENRKRLFSKARKCPALLCGIKIFSKGILNFHDDVDGA